MPGFDALLASQAVGKSAAFLGEIFRENIQKKET